MRILAEALHIAAGISVALLIGALSAWAYPLAARDIWVVTAIAVACVVLMGIRPMRRAMTGDPGEKDANDA